MCVGQVKGGGCWRTALLTALLPLAPPPLTLSLSHTHSHTHTHTAAAASQGKELLPEEVLCVNTEFASKFFRVRIPLISATSLAPGSGSGAAGDGGRRDVEGDDVQAQVESQRKTMTDAAIVRIMK